MQIELLEQKGFTANCYIIKNKNFTAVIDPGIYYEKAVLELKKADNAYILLTHCHFDHILGVKKIKEETNATIFISEPDKDGLKDSRLSLASEVRQAQHSVEADELIYNNTLIPFYDTDIKVISTPGHTKGSVCFLIKDKLFSGDTLFSGSIGRTDFPTGDYGEIKESLKKLTKLNENIVVYPGHGEATTIKDEKNFNPFLKDL